LDSELGVKGYTDASFQTNIDDFRSQSGYVSCLNGGAVVWKEFQTENCGDSTTEKKYLAALEAAKEVVWIKKFVTELGVVLSISKKSRSHHRSKHILRRYHLIREYVNTG
jgi:hypothetical protein